jgi:hypothetical protein
MFRIIRDHGVRIETLCDQCREEITAARKAIAVCANHDGDMAVLHKGACDQAFKATHPEAAYGCFELDHALAVMAGGVGLDAAGLAVAAERMSVFDA